MALLLLFAVAACVLAEPSSENVTPVEVTLYYETLCPGCRTFIPTELFPTYTDTDYDFASLISKLTLVPYGWAEVINATGHDYRCQHGKSECEGNRLQSCAIKYIKDQVTTLSYISCLENLGSAALQNGSTEYPIDKCKNKLPRGLYPKIIDCYQSDEGWELFAKNGKKTRSFFPSGGFVPYVSFNNKKDDHLALAAIDNFKETLCKVTGVVDKACFHKINLNNKINYKYICLCDSTSLSYKKKLNFILKKKKSPGRDSNMGGLYPGQVKIDIFSSK